MRTRRGRKSIETNLGALSSIVYTDVTVEILLTDDSILLQNLLIYQLFDIRC